jgi:MFS family permease
MRDHGMRRLRWHEYITLNLYWLGLNIRNTALGTIFMPYLVDIYAPQAIKNTALGAMRTAGLIIAMLVQPAAGLLSDRSTSRFGRRRPFIFIGTIFDMIFLAALALSWNYWSLLAAVLLIQLSSNISHGPLQGLIPDLVPEDQRGRASAVKAIMELLPLILVGFTIAPLVGAGKLPWAIFATAAFLFLIMLLTMLFVKEKPLKQRPPTPFWPPMLRVLGMLAGILVGALAGLLAGGLVGGLAALIVWIMGTPANPWAVGVGLGGGVAMVVAVVVGVWAGALATLSQDARRQSSFVWWIVNRLMFLTAVTSIQGIAPFFLMYAFHVGREAAASMTGNLIMIVGLFTLATALPSGWLADRLGRKRLVGSSGLLAAVGGGMLLSTIWMPNMGMIYISGIVIGLATGLFMTANWALGTDLVPAAEAGRYLGISNLAGAGAGMIGTGIGGPIADYLNGILPGLGYFAILASYAVLFALSTLALLWMRRGER